MHFKVTGTWNKLGVRDSFKLAQAKTSLSKADDRDFLNQALDPNRSTFFCIRI